MKRRDLLRGLVALPAADLASASRTLATAPKGGATDATAASAPPATEKRIAPAWLPAPGMRRDISLNMMADVDPCASRDCVYSGATGQRAVLAAWSGAAFAPQYGRLGAWIITGGGHGDYFGNEVYAFELDSLRWVRINAPYAGGPASEVDYVEGEYAPGVPLSSHAYQHTQYLPPALGGGPKGSLLLLVKYAAGKLAKGSGRTHACDLSTGTWSRYSANRAREHLQGMSATAFDPRRKGFWRVPYGGRVLEFLDSADRRWHPVTVVGDGGNAFGIDHVCALDTRRDLLVVLDWTRGGGTAWGLELASRRAWYRLHGTSDLLPPATRGMSIDWCAPLDCFVCYAGRGATAVHKLLAPRNGDSNTWRWESEAIDGDAPAGRRSGPAPSYSRFRFADAIGCFIWADGNRLPVQAWRLRGT